MEQIPCPAIERISRLNGKDLKESFGPREDCFINVPNSLKIFMVKRQRRASQLLSLLLMRNCCWTLRTRNHQLPELVCSLAKIFAFGPIGFTQIPT